MLAGHLASPTSTAATWKVVEKHLQDLSLSWFEDVSPDECNAENCSPNAQPAVAASAGTCKAVMLVSPAPQDFQQLSHFLRVSQGKCCLNSSIIRSSSSSSKVHEQDRNVRSLSYALLQSAGLEVSNTLQSMDPAGVTATLVDKVSLTIANRFQKSGIRLFWSSLGTHRLWPLALSTIKHAQHVRLLHLV